MAISIGLGIFFGLLASFIQSLGLTIQRKSHVLNQNLPENQQRLEYKRPLWLLGFAIFISSNVVGSLVQIASLPVVILAPLGAVSLLWNAFFARLLLGDVFSAWMILGTLFIAGGAVLIAFFGIVPEPTRSLEDLLALFRRPAFVVYFSLLGAVVIVCLVITHVIEFRLSKRLAVTDATPSPAETETDLGPLATGITDAAEMVASERTPLLDSKSNRPSRAPSIVSAASKLGSDPAIRSINRTRILLAISYASFSGIISGMCLLFAKSGVELLLLTIQGDNQFWRWQSWVLLLALVIFALLQLWYLHKALVLADPTLVCPSAFCFYNLSSIVNGLVYFDQFSLISPLHLALVCLGIVVLLAGVWVVSIQAGGGGVDFAAWNGDDEISVVNEEESCNEPSPHPPSTLSRAPMSDDEDAPEWGTHSEPLMGTSSISSPPPERTRLSPESSQYSVSRPSGSNRRRLPGLESFSRHRRGSTFSHYSPNNTYTSQRPPLSPPLPTVSTLAGTGFQIGLSPVSPGFNIVPLERRRRTSNLGLGPPPGMDGERRRTVSEGQVRRMEVELEQGDREEGTRADVPGRGRWSWLRVLSGTRG
ncbi:hypothetical protein K435DRAFT_816805 [Dendrothele bispora CBS 962.96]|uniref:DUF803-domain-containing protein n=1 Tax=Dendrothele bispora (strain CBS 962.96) TaxID=1314807 RepID=A0A4V4HI23_DENBC|nr:hypothetical protein K435DRAFT_816805 [Dendrothele bispora CBS 962.96]